MTEVDLVVVSMVFDAAAPEQLGPLLAKFAVMTREEPGCRNLDLLASSTVPGRFVLVVKWESADAQRAHFDSPVMVELAEGCRSLLIRPPQIDLLDPISAHDLI